MPPRVGPNSSAVEHTDVEELPPSAAAILSTVQQSIEAAVDKAVKNSLDGHADGLARQLMPLMRASLQSTIKETVEDSVSEQLELYGGIPNYANKGTREKGDKPKAGNGVAKMPAVSTGADNGRRSAEESSSPRGPGGTIDPTRAQRDQFLAKFMHTEVFGQTTGTRGGGESFRSRHSGPRNRFVLNPSLRGRFSWDVLVVLLTAFMALELPFRLAFHFFEATSTPWLVYDYMVCAILIVDIMLNFRTGYIGEGGELVMNPSRIATHYLRTWFIIDFSASVPWDGIFGAFAGASPGDGEATAGITTVRLLRLLRLPRLLRVTHFLSYLEQWEGTALLLTANTVRIAKLVGMMLMFTHWDGCVHYLVAQLESNVDADSGARMMEPDSWTARSGLTTRSAAWHSYLISLFNAFSQMLCIGYGTVEPIRTAEVLVTLLSMALGATLYGLFIASLTSFLADSEASARIYSSQLDMLKQYMKHRQLPAALRQKLRTYLELCFPNKRAFDERAILSSLNLPLRREVSYEKSKQMLERLPLFEPHMVKEGLMGALALALERQVFVADDYILREGEYGQDMYFIASGEVSVVTGPPGQHVEVARLKEGAFFGEMALLTQSERHMASVLVVSFCEALWMSRESYRQLSRSYPSIREYLEAIARLRLASALARGKKDKDELRGADLETLVALRKSRNEAAQSRKSVAPINGRQSVVATAMRQNGAGGVGNGESSYTRAMRRASGGEDTSAAAVVKSTSFFAATPGAGGGGPPGRAGRRGSVQACKAARSTNAGWSALDAWSPNDADDAMLASAAAANVLYSGGGGAHAE